MSANWAGYQDKKYFLEAVKKKQTEQLNRWIKKLIQIDSKTPSWKHRELLNNFSGDTRSYIKTNPSPSV